MVFDKTLESPLDSKEIQSILREISLKCSLERLMLKLKLQWFVHLMQRTSSWKRPWCWERLKAGGEGDDRGWDGWMASPTQWTWVWVGYGSWWQTGKPGVLQSMGSQRVGHDWATELKTCFVPNLQSILEDIICALGKNVYFSVVWSFLWKCFKWN